MAKIGWRHRNTEIEHTLELIESLRKNVDEDLLQSEIIGAYEKLNDSPAVSEGIPYSETVRTLINGEVHLFRDLKRLQSYRDFPQRDFNVLLERGAVYSFHLDASTCGSEMRDTHPCVVVSDTRRYNATGTVIVVPITSANSRRDIILHKRNQPRRQWDAEALTKIPISATPATESVKFLDVQQLRAVSPARVGVNEQGRPLKLRTLTAECLEELESSIQSYLGMESIHEMATKLKNTLKAKRDEEKKGKKLRKCMLETRSAVAALKENKNIDAEYVLTQILKELDEALEL